MEAAKSVSEEMAEIYLERNMQLQIPGWDFQGACLGLDIRRVVETGITPLINTGIAHKEAGIGQIGAGTVRAAGLFRAGAGSAGGKHGRKLRERLMKRIHPLMASRQSADYRQPRRCQGYGVALLILWRKAVSY